MLALHGRRTVVARDLLRGLEVLLFGDLLQGQAGGLVDGDDDELREEGDAENDGDVAVEQVEALGLGEGADDGVDEADADEGQRNGDGHEEALLALLGVRDVEGHDGRQDDDGNVGDDEERRAGLVQVRRRVACEARRDVVVRGVDAAHDAEDEADDDDQVDEVEHACVQNGALSLVDRVEEAREEPNGGQLEGREADVLQDRGAGVQAGVRGVGDGGQLHARADDSGEAEDDEEEPARVLPQTVTDCEEGCDAESRDIDGDFGDGDAVAVGESHDVCVLGEGSVKFFFSSTLKDTMWMVEILYVSLALFLCLT